MCHLDSPTEKLEGYVGRFGQVTEGRTHDSVDEILRGTLSIAIACPVCCACFVECASTPCRAHLGEIESTIDAARNLRDVNIERDFLVQQLEYIIGRIISQEIDSRGRQRGDISALGKEIES